MNPQEYGLLEGLVIIYVFVFDIIDLHPQIGSFGFLKSFAYWAYFIIRLVLSSVAALILATVQPDLLIPVIALVGVVASVTVLQSLTLNVGGKEIANATNLLESYKAKMISDESERRGARDDASILEIVQGLVKWYEPRQLRDILRSMLLNAKWSPEDITKHIEEHEQAGEQDIKYIMTIFANEIAEMNQDYAKKLLETEKLRELSKPEETAV